MVKEVLEKIDLQGVKGILIDLDDTIYPYHINHERAMGKCILRCENKFQISREDFDKYFKSARESIHHQLSGQAASHSRLLYFQKLYELLSGMTNPDFALEMEELYWSEFLSGVAFYPGVEVFLKKAKAMGIRLCIVTDLTAQIQFRKWKGLDLGRYADFMVSSEEAGIEKPAQQIFNMALEKLSLKANEVIMIGDNKEKDINGAEALGIRSYLVK